MHCFKMLKQYLHPTKKALPWSTWAVLRKAESLLQLLPNDRRGCDLE